MIRMQIAAIRKARLRSAHLTALSCKATRRGLGSLPPRLKSDSKVVYGLVASTLLAYSLYQTDDLQSTHFRSSLVPEQTNTNPAVRPQAKSKDDTDAGSKPETNDSKEETGGWVNFITSFEGISLPELPEVDSISDKVVDLILPEWTKAVPGFIRKLQRELDMAPDSLAAEIWKEAYDPYTHPEIEWEAKVRVSNDLCDEEKTFLQRRKLFTAPALAKYLGLKEEDVHPDDVPTIAMCGSGGGLRALVAGSGSFQATTEDGLFDCVTYASGVSGSCWLQSLYYSSVTGNSFKNGIEHLKARLGTHIAYPPVAFASLISAPTNKYLLSGIVEKYKGDPSADFSLVDVYGVLLAARLLVPKGELGVEEKDFKLSNQREYIRYGQNPMPIYTAIRHEIPEMEVSDAPVSEEAKDRAKRESWFQWFEISPFEFFCEEFSAGIPTWAMGRKFNNGIDVPSETGFRLPETRMPLLLGIWGSAFCATLSHYYREIRPLVRSITGFQAVDDLIWGMNPDLSKVHPLDPAAIPNFTHGMHGKLPGTVPPNLYDKQYLQLMDAGMSNNLPIYPLLRPGRDVDIIISFDASADVKTDNWLSVIEGYAKQRNIKGWPLGIGWPSSKASVASTAAQLEKAQNKTAKEAEESVTEAKIDQAARRIEAGNNNSTPSSPPPTTSPDQPAEAAGELGYCTVWVGTTTERTTNDGPPPTTSPIDDSSSFKLMEPDAGIAVIYLPFLANEKAVPGVDPAKSDYMSTWNFVYTPEQVDDVVKLARANYSEGREQIRRTVRAVYERKKKRRMEMERKEREERWRRFVRRGVWGIDEGGKGGEGDHFS
ncbi:FabD/lysophospholipase-like protein [Podospora fimiseda]|uniref:Lysophospholipase n=1 Tax=Podospora fimiseda TaxID=252190 RepID=A0AAN7H7P5_9PEZI|nr:FabD/lysophospholipase-like protein [Podospora fimiseda]